MDGNSQKIKICYLITGLNTGGAEMMLYRLVERMDKSKYIITVISILPLGEIANKLKKLNISIISLNMKSKMDIFAIIRMVRIIKEIRPTILHSFMTHANILGRIFGKILGVPINISGIRTTNLEGKFRELAMKYTDTLSDATTIVSKAAAIQMINKGIVSKEKVHIIYNGIEPMLYNNQENNVIEVSNESKKYIFLTVGRLDESKGYPYLIQSASILKKRGYNYLWLIAGEGKLRPVLEHLVIKHNVEDRIKFLGLRDDVPRLLRNSDIFILPSLWEGLPGVVLEAMATGLPVVATDVGGTSEIIEDGKSGYLVPPRQPSLMADAIEKLIKMGDEERKKMGITGAEIVRERFTVEQMVRNHEKLYLDLIRQKRILDHFQ